MALYYCVGISDSSSRNLVCAIPGGHAVTVVTVKVAL